MSTNLAERVEIESVETKHVFKEVYKASNIFRAAGQLAADCVRFNLESVKRISSDYKPKFFDPFLAVIAEPLKYPICYATFISAYIFSFCTLRYSPEEKGYTFREKTTELKVFEGP